MKKSIFIAFMCISIIFIMSCAKKINKPFGADSSDYDKVEGINKDGPIAESYIPENVPPISDKTVVENGPRIMDTPKIVVLPTSDLDEEPDYGGIPVVETTQKE